MHLPFSASAFCVKNTNKIREISGMCNCELQGVFLSNLVWEVVYIRGTTYINLVEIAPIALNYNRLKRCKQGFT